MHITSTIPTVLTVKSVARLEKPLYALSQAARIGEEQAKRLITTTNDQAWTLRCNTIGQSIERCRTLFNTQVKDGLRIIYGQWIERVDVFDPAAEVRKYGGLCGCSLGLSQHDFDLARYMQGVSWEGAAAAECCKEVQEMLRIGPQQTRKEFPHCSPPDDPRIILKSLADCRGSLQIAQHMFAHIAGRTAQATLGKPTFQNRQEDEKKPEHIKGASCDMLFDWEYVVCTVGDSFLFEVDRVNQEGCMCTLRHPKSPRSVAGWMSIDETVAMLLARKSPPCPPKTASLKQRLTAPKKKQG